MSTINWTISVLDCLPQAEGQTNVVVTAHWQCTGTQEQDGNTYSSSVYGTCSFTYTGGEFTPYADLTQEQVLEWCWNSGVDKASAEAAVNQNIAQQINPPIITPALPWSQQ